MIKVIIIGGVRDFHAMDWYHVLTDIQGINSTLFVTDSISSEGLHDMSRSDDNIEKLFIVDRFLFSSQTRFANYWRNFIKLLVLPIQVYMLKSIKKKNPNAVFHAHPMYYLFIAWISRIQCGVTPQGSEILVRPDRSLMYKFFTVRCLRYASFVTVDSISMKNKIFELSGVTASVVQNGIDTTAILNSSNSVTSRDKISSIRGMAPLYNIDKILATRNLTSPDLGINFIFPFIASDYYDSIKKQFIQNDNVIGRLSRNEMYSFLSQSLLTISIPSSDSSPRSVYEAIFAGSFVAILENEYIKMLTPCMLNRVIFIDLSDESWLDTAIRYAKNHSHLTYHPSPEALDRFDQYRSLYNATDLLYRISKKEPVKC